MSDKKSFEIFKSNVCHILKAEGDLSFIVNILKSDKIRAYWKKEQYPESFYLLAMIDYLCRIHDFPICTDFNDMRKYSLSEPIYPLDAILADRLDSTIEACKKCREGAIPEFLRFNIIESEIRDVA